MKPGYKRSVLGVIPEEWEVLEGHQFATIKTGPFGTLLKASEYSRNAGVPLISVGEIRAGYLAVTDETPRVSQAVTRRLPQYVLKQGDIVFGRKGGVERSALVQPQHDGWFLGSDGIAIRPWKDCSKGYVGFQCQSARVREWLLKNAIGTTMPSMNQEILRKISIPFPPTQREQEAIAEALSEADALIRSLEQLVSKKRLVKQGAMRELLTGKTRLPGFRHSGRTRTSIGEVPNDWMVTVVGDLFSVKTGPFGSSLHERDYVASGTPIVTVEHLGERGLVHVNLPFVSEGDCKRLASYVLAEGDIVFSRVGSVDRNVRISSLEAGWLFSGRLLRLRAFASDVSTTFVSYQFRTELFKQRVRAAAVGQTMASLNTRIVKNLPMVVPPLAEQVAIADILSDMDTEIAALEMRLAKTRALKQGMMQELLTGRIRLV